MIKLATKFDVLQSHFIDGKGIKAIAKEFSISKNTVKKYVREYAMQKKEILLGGDKSEILLEMNDKPKYNTEKRKRKVMTDEMIDVINKCLYENDNKKAMGKTKLCMKAVDIYELLIEKGYKLSYPTVANYVREISNRKKEAFIKQEYQFGEICEFDWGDAKLNIGGNEMLLKMATFTLARSNIRYALLFHHEDTQAFIEAHVKFFAFLGHVPHTMVYDNMRVAIAKFVGKTEKIATIALKQMSTYYEFNFRFCNICCGNEKGHVERSVEFVRRKAFSSVGAFDNLDEAVLRLNTTLNKLNSDKEELLEKEKSAMLEKMPDYSSVVRTSGLVNKFSTVSFKRNHYSVPDYLVNKEVEIFVFIDQIVIKFKGNEVAKHNRSYKQNEYILDIMHYRETLMKKPGALKSSVCLKQACDVLNVIFLKFFSESPREFILLLDLINDYTIHQLQLTIETLLKTGAKVNIDNIKMILQKEESVYVCCNQDDIEKACKAQLAQYSEVVA